MKIPWLGTSPAVLWPRTEMCKSQVAFKASCPQSTEYPPSSSTSSTSPFSLFTSLSLTHTQSHSHISLTHFSFRNVEMFLSVLISDHASQEGKEFFFILYFLLSSVFLLFQILLCTHFMSPCARNGY